MRSRYPIAWALAVTVMVPALAFGLDKLTVVHSSVSGSQAVLFVTRDARIFEKHGLEVDIRFIAGGPPAISALLAGEADLALMAGPASIIATLGGADAIVIMAVVNTMDHVIFAQTSIKTPADIKGKKLGVSRFNSADDFAARYVLRRWGLTPMKDVTILQLGEQSARLMALRAGAIDATSLQPPLTAVARRDGLTELAKLSALGLEYLQTCVTTTRATVRAREDVLRRFARAFVEGIHFYKTSKEASMASIGKFMRLTDHEAIEESYKTYALTLTPRVPAPTARGIQTILDDLAPTDPRAKAARAEQFMEPRFILELEETRRSSIASTKAGRSARAGLSGRRGRPASPAHTGRESSQGQTALNGLTVLRPYRPCGTALVKRRPS